MDTEGFTDYILAVDLLYFQDIYHKTAYLLLAPEMMTWVMIC